MIAGRDEFLDSLEVQGCISFFRSILNPKDLLVPRGAEAFVGFTGKRSDQSGL